MLSDAEGSLFLVLCMGAGGLALGAVGLWLESRAPTRRVQTVALAVGAALWAAAGAAAWADAPAAACVGLAVLGAACLAAAAVHEARVRQWASRLLQPRAVWGLLLVGGPAFAWAATRHLNDPDPVPPLSEPLPIDRREVADHCAVTDQGHSIPLYNLAVPQSAEQYEAEYVADSNLTCRLIRTGDVDPTYNCHGWVFTGGQFALRSEDVEQILSDNHYHVVEAPQPGDLIIYRDGVGEIAHTGLVRSLIEGEIVLIESKWGPFGRYLHTPDAQPYGPNYVYYRSPRHGHLLSLVDTPDGAERGAPKPRPPAGAAPLQGWAGRVVPAT